MSNLLQERLESFLDQGYVIIPHLFNDKEINVISKSIENLKKHALDLATNVTDYMENKILSKGTQFVIQKFADDFIQIKRTVWAGKAEPELLEISRQDKLLNIVSKLLNTTSADHIINQIHYKFPGDNISFPPHQDIHNRRAFDHLWKNVNGDRSYVVCITAIDKNTIENGPLKYVKGSHKWGEVNLDSLKDIVNLDDAEVLLLNSGDTVCIHQYLVHYSEPNLSSNSRNVLINGFSYPGANHALYPGDGSGETISLVGMDEILDEL